MSGSQLTSFGSDERANDALLDNQFSVEDVMSKNMVTIKPTTSVREAAEMLAEGHFHSLPVFLTNLVKRLFLDWRFASFSELKKILTFCLNNKNKYRDNLALIAKILLKSDYLCITRLAEINEQLVNNIFDYL